jgi:hypothetical protein
MLQESGGNPTAVNQGEGANGLMQWRGDRWDNLQKFAKDQGKTPTDPEVQLDFVGKELAGPEKKAGQAFLAAPDVASASAALKPYIRFGDDSAGTRLANAKNLYGQLSGPVGALDAAAAPAPQPGAPMALPSSPDAAPQGPPLPASNALANLGTALSGGAGQPGAAPAQPQQPDFLPAQQIQMAQPQVGQSQQIAAALAKAYGLQS